MAADVNRVWVSVERGSYGANQLIKFFAGGDTVEELTDRLAQAFGPLAADNIIGHVAALGTEEAFDNLKGGGAVGGNFASNDQSSSRKADGPICKHGPRVWKEGVKNGKAWKAWMCPAQQGAPDKCSPEWA
jgi:hypothetical protein